jgi:hypothetical protein
MQRVAMTLAVVTDRSVQPRRFLLREDPSDRGQAHCCECGARKVVSPSGVGGSRVSGIAARAHTTTPVATGTLILKARRHPGPSTRQPPMNGPIAPATPPSPDHAPTALATIVLPETSPQDCPAPPG